jgi:DNA polymerase delta subunit 1
LILRGQGIKLTSFVAKKCREKNTLLKDLPRKSGNEGYEGAIVLPPKCGMYMDNPVACVDYSSLYPSSMICNNFSHDSLVYALTYDMQHQLIHQEGERDPETGLFRYDGLPQYRYTDIQFDNYDYDSKKCKVKVGYTVCRWAQGKKAVMPSILEELLKARNDTKKLAKKETDPFMQNVLDKRQLAYKMTANSLYGQCGATTSTFYHKMIAAKMSRSSFLKIGFQLKIAP